MALDPMGLPLFDVSGGLWIKLTVCGVTRLGYGHAESKEYMDPGAREKEVIGDALRNACMRFGAALELWHKGELRPQLSEVVAEGEFVEPEAPPAPKETKQLSAPKAAKATASAAPKPAAVTQPTLPSVEASEPTTNGKSSNGKADGVPSIEQVVASIAPEKLNSALTSCMNQMTPKWRLIEIRRFYAEHFSEEEMPSPDNMDPELKRQILAKMMEVNKVAPF
jgi:hypothetical protein